jgi:aminoglycoside phosphotransferase (APT) family kinase protein
MAPRPPCQDGNLPAPIRAALAEAGLATGGTWTPLRGGRTNRLWRSAEAGLVCKLYSGAASPLFPNDPEAEALALRALAGRQIAPALVARARTAEGAVLVYRHEDGTAGAAEVEEVARLLRRLHGMAAPGGLPAKDDPLAQGDAMLRGLPEAAALAALRPAPVATTPTPPVFLHGDPVPANIIRTPDGPRLIDWQCPARGEASEDLAIFLSPAMQQLYGNGPLSQSDEARFLAAYGDPLVVRRYRDLAPAYHWRMAAHCLWKAGQGAPEYAAAAELELARLRRPPR